MSAGQQYSCPCNGFLEGFFSANPVIIHHRALLLKNHFFLASAIHTYRGFLFILPTSTLNIRATGKTWLNEPKKRRVNALKKWRGCPVHDPTVKLDRILVGCSPFFFTHWPCLLYQLEEGKGNKRKWDCTRPNIVLLWGVSDGIRHILVMEGKYNLFLSWMTMLSTTKQKMTILLHQSFWAI